MVGIIVILAILWFLGVITKNTFGGVLHILLVIAVVFLPSMSSADGESARLRLRPSRLRLARWHCLLFRRLPPKT